MKKIQVFLLLLFLWQSPLMAQNPNYTEIADILQEFQTAVGGYYGTRVLRISEGMTAATIEKYMASWKANRCLLRGIIMATEEDLGFNPDMNLYTLVIKLPKGLAYFGFKYNQKGFLKFASYETEGNINSCPAGNTPTNNFYANVDLVGIWKFKDIGWYRYPIDLKESLRNEGFDEEKIKNALEVRLQNLQQPELITYSVIQFLANGTAVITTLNGEKTIQWRLQYNQLQIKENSGDWSALTWRIDNEGNLNWIDSSMDRDEVGEVKFVYTKN